MEKDLKKKKLCELDFVEGMIFFSMLRTEENA